MAANVFELGISDSANAATSDHHPGNFVEKFIVYGKETWFATGLDSGSSPRCHLLIYS